MKTLIFFATILFSLNLWATPLSFNGALALEICPKNSDCFRKHEGINFTINLNPIYEDSDILIDYGSWESSTTIQNIGIVGGIEITKTIYKNSNEIYWEYIVYTQESSGKAKAKSTYSYKEPSRFDGVLNLTGSVIDSSRPIQHYPVFIVAPEGFNWKTIVRNSKK